MKEIEVILKSIAINFFLCYGSVALGLKPSVGVDCNKHTLNKVRYIMTNEKQKTESKRFILDKKTQEKIDAVFGAIENGEAPQTTDTKLQSIGI